MDMSTPRMVYIMGRGHSGSTVLDGLLGAAVGAFSAGELISGWRRYQEPCGCGVATEDCPVWKAVRSNFEARAGIDWDDAGRDLQSQTMVGKYPTTLVSRSRSIWVRRLATINQSVVEATTEVAQCEMLVDSTKEATRALFLAKFQSNCQLVHLVRDPSAMIASNLHRLHDGTGFRFYRRTYYGTYLAPIVVVVSSVGWVVGNLLCEIAHLFARGRTLRIRYEDLCQAPSRTVERLGDFLSLDVRPVISAIEQGTALPNGHKIAGNRMRLQKEFRFDPSRIKSRPIPAVYRAVSFLITLPLRIVYRYV